MRGKLLVSFSLVILHHFTVASTCGATLRGGHPSALRAAPATKVRSVNPNHFPLRVAPLTSETLPPNHGEIGVVLAAVRLKHIVDFAALGKRKSRSPSTSRKIGRTYRTLPFDWCRAFQVANWYQSRHVKRLPRPLLSRDLFSSSHTGRQNTHVPPRSAI